MLESSHSLRLQQVTCSGKHLSGAVNTNCATLCNATALLFSISTSWQMRRFKLPHMCNFCLPDCSCCTSLAAVCCCALKAVKVPSRLELGHAKDLFCTVLLEKSGRSEANPSITTWTELQKTSGSMLGTDSHPDSQTG